MIHYFEFIAVKKQTEEEKKDNKEKEYYNMLYKTESARTNKVAILIKKELAQKKILQPGDIEDFYLREIQRP